ncbi:MAG: acyl-CoA dehydratase activase-related protein [Clostridia bacterium]|nr:acyl-CoA dehydratase activase-related protein [Clostridia bacterium]
MPKTVGIPRGLFFYEYYPLWKRFFEELGAQVILSEPTSKQILDAGVKSCVDEACLPLKVFHGHVLNLVGKVDYLFIPRLTSVSKNEYICPKIGGLPDMIKHTLQGLPRIIDTEINLRKSSSNAYKAAYEIGMNFSSNSTEIRKAYKKALQSHEAHKEKLKSGILPDEIFSKKSARIHPKKELTLDIAVIGHAYNLFDSYVSMEMLAKLRKNNINIHTIDMVDESDINQMHKALRKRMFWNFGRRAVGSALHFLGREGMDGVIYVMSFGCGVDSFVCDMVERRIRQNSDIPFIVLTLDEHSGEAGMDTRLEAFIDMIRWRKLNESNIPAYG